MLTFISQTSGKDVSYNLGAPLGRGMFSAVFALQTPEKQATDLVCKLTKIKPLELTNGAVITRRTVLKGILNELNILNKLGRLEGYHRVNDIVCIIMKRIPGEKAKAKDTAKCYKALRKLNRQGIAHIDATLDNYLIDNHSASPVDFMNSREATHITTLLDTALFHVANQIPSELTNNYINEMKEYATHNRLDLLIDFVNLTAVAVGFIFGRPASDVSQQLFLEFCSAYATYQFSKEISSLFFIELGGVGAPEATKAMVQKAFYLERAADFYINYLELSYYWLKDGIGSLFMFFPLMRIMSTLHDLYLEWAPETVLLKTNELYFNYTPRLWRTFSSSAREVEVQCTPSDQSQHRAL